AHGEGARPLRLCAAPQPWTDGERGPDESATMLRVHAFMTSGATMKAVLRTLAVAGLTLGTFVALPAQAQSGGYVTMGYVLSDLEPKRARSSADVDALQFGFGGWFNPEQTFGAEGRIALGLGDDKFTNQNGIRGKVEIDR